jgi:hypothetical protein
VTEVVGVFVRFIVRLTRSKSLSNTFNAANLLEENYKTQTNLGEENNNLSYFDRKKASYLLNNTAVKWEFNKSATTFISYSAPTDDAMKQNLDNELIALHIKMKVA